MGNARLNTALQGGTPVQSPCRSARPASIMAMHALGVSEKPVQFRYGARVAGCSRDHMKVSYHGHT